MKVDCPACATVNSETDKMCLACGYDLKYKRIITNKAVTNMPLQELNKIPWSALEDKVNKGIADALRKR